MRIAARPPVSGVERGGALAWQGWNDPGPSGRKAVFHPLLCIRDAMRCPRCPLPGEVPGAEA